MSNSSLGIISSLTYMLSCCSQNCFNFFNLLLKMWLFTERKLPEFLIVPSSITSSISFFSLGDKFESLFTIYIGHGNKPCSSYVEG